MILSGLGLNFSCMFESCFCDFEWFLGSIFEAFGSLEGVWALPGAPWGPLGGQGAPNMGPGSEKLVRWTPPGLPK